MNKLIKIKVDKQTTIELKDSSVPDKVIISITQSKKSISFNFDKLELFAFIKSYHFINDIKVLEPELEELLG